MFFDIIPLIKKTSLYRERYALPETLADTQNQKYSRSI
jgi:hypothetical protein